MTGTTRVHRPGAPLLPPVIAYTVLLVCGVSVPPLIAGFAPWRSDAAQLDFFQNHVGAAHALAFFTLGSAVPLLVLTAVATTRLRMMGIDVPGRIIAQLGGTVASALLAVSGLATLALTQDRVADSAASVRALTAVSFAAGGPGFVLFQGLLIAGVSISALVRKVVPGWLGWGGIGLAVVSELAALSVAFDAADFLLPIGRFGGALWVIAIGLLLPSSRRELRERRGIVRAADASATA